MTAAGHIAGLARRNLLRTLRTPQLLVFTFVQPVMLLLLFRYALGGAIRVPGMAYVDYVVPAVFLEAVVVGYFATAVGLAQDVGSGIVDRFRSLPMARSAVLAGRTLADLARSFLSLAVMVLLGVAVGFRFHNGFWPALAGFGVVLLFGYGFAWVYATIGLLTRDPESAQAAGVVPFFVLIFASSAFVPVETMPGWLQPFARNQPVTVTVNALRALFGGGPAWHWVWLSLVWAAAVIGVFFLTSLAAYRRLTR
jgi:ABC-2 type transport system permease protein/oleandomycin transport system permease protein